LVSQPSYIYIYVCVCVCVCVGQYTIVMVEVTTQEYNYNIFYIVCLQYFLYRCINMPPHAEGGGSTQSLKRKAVNEAVRSGLEDICKLIVRGNKMNLNLLLCNSISDKMIINLNMFCASMKNRIHRQISDTKVITPNDGAETNEI